MTAERIRDKIAASKKKGMWMGGVPPLGYDPHPDPNRRELVVNDLEVKTVRRLFDLYVDHKCLAKVTRAAEELGLRSKKHAFSTGRVQGGNPLSRGQIHKILTNPVYCGLIRHKDKTYPGLHDAIIDQTLWDKVQTLLQSASAKRRGARAGDIPDHAAPLKGKIRDETGDLLTPTHTNRGNKRIRYYISNRLISGGTDGTGWRLPARTLEAAIAKLVTEHLTSCAKRHAVLALAEALQSERACHAITVLADRIEAEGAPLAASLVSTAQIGEKETAITLDAPALAKVAGLNDVSLSSDILQISAPFLCRRRGVEMKIIAGDRARTPDPAILSGLRRAHLWAGKLKSGMLLKDLAREAKVSERYAARVIPLVGLSPRIQTAIVTGSQPPELTLERLVRSKLPMAWDEQERMLGFA